MNTTLVEFDTCPMFQQLNGAALHLSHVLPKQQQIYNQPTLRHIEQDAIDFYVLNHRVSELRLKYHPLEPLSDTDVYLLHNYADVLKEVAGYLVAYITAITIREVRHAKTRVLGAEDGSLNLTVARYINECIIPHGDTASFVLKEFLYSDLDASFLDLMTVLESAFTHCSFETNYGGESWARVARHLKRYLNGDFSTEAFIDGCFHLAHNTGSIFNKGVVYAHFDTCFGIILDCQNAGQVPNLAANTKSLNFNLDPSYISPLVKQVTKGASPVNWDRVLPEAKNKAVVQSMINGDQAYGTPVTVPRLPSHVVRMDLAKGEDKTVIQDFSVKPNKCQPYPTSPIMNILHRRGDLESEL
ncbi:hypothetical protein ValSw41_4 [Vibrio phage ValSw4_1]|nr:hypothetical protein ValSw41_4 [Vibrio phage ValSw4_1]QQO38270.1 hypothetical protein [Vibrio phage vB_VpaS_VP-RY-9]